MPVNDELLDRVLEGNASADEVAELEAWLEVPANLETFARRAELHANLRRSLRRRNIQANATVVDEVTSPRQSGAGLVTSSTAYEFSFARPWVALCAGVVATAVCLVVAFLNFGVRENRDPDKRHHATIVSEVKSLLTRNGRTWQGAGLSNGEYQLERGLLNLRLAGGVLVYVEAPAQFDIASAKKVVLRSGRLSASVPPEGVGFTVETPEAEVVDFGTEFSVDVEAGTSEVHVFDGLVRVQPRTWTDGITREAIDLRADHAIKIEDSTEKPINIELARDRFIRDFAEPKRNYARAIKQLSPLAYYRMGIRDRGLVSIPPEHSGIVLTGEGKRPPHACGVFVGGSLRVGADSTGRGGRVDSPPALNTGAFSLAVFVYLEEPGRSGAVATNRDGVRGSFTLSLGDEGMLQATVKDTNGNLQSVAGESVLSVETWRHVVVTADGERLQLFEDGKLVATAPCAAVAATNTDTVWFGTDAKSLEVWNGRVDELALFDRALTEEQIAGLYRTAQEEIARSR
ncbi:MAG: FecR domain-containing protein [Planctomycetota bacterium]|nr:FecR domain-containing protein [Planctomycetota bacterium]MDA1159187.1 FecR domain-containing protein [Planctomycetota bacterium]